MKSLRALVGEPKAKNVAEKLKFSAAGVERLLEIGENLYPKETWSANKLYASGLGYTSVPEFVASYFDKDILPKNFSAKVCMSMEAGTAIHNYIQSRLMFAGVLHPKADSKFYKELRFEDEELRVVSKVDGLVDEMQLAELGKKGFEGEPEPRPLKLDLLEIKVLNSHTYEKTKEWPDISLPYRMQATATQKISGYERTIFMVVNRADWSFRFIVYRAEEHLWDTIKKMSEDIFNHLRNLTKPEGFKDEWLVVNETKLEWDQWVQYHIDRQPKRKWLHKVEEDDKLEQSFLLF